MSNAQQTLEQTHGLDETLSRMDVNGRELSDEELEAIAGGRFKLEILWTGLCVEAGE